MRLLHARHGDVVIDLVHDNPKAERSEIRAGLEGNICRCTGYHNIVKAVQRAGSSHRAKRAKENTHG